MSSEEQPEAAQNDAPKISGNDAIAAAEQRAASTSSRNLPLFGDLPIDEDTANLRAGADLNDACLALLPLIGVWRGTGEASYPTLDKPQRYGQQIVFSHDGRPFVQYEARSWLLDDEDRVLGPGDRETGWWRPQPDDTIEVLISRMSGNVEIYYGKPLNTTSWEIGSDAILRTPSGKDIAAAARLYGVVPDGDLAYVEERAMEGQEIQPYLSAKLQRIAG